MTAQTAKEKAAEFFDEQNENDTKARCIAYAKTIMVGWAAADPTLTPEAIEANAQTAFEIAQAIDAVNYHE